MLAPYIADEGEFTALPKTLKIPVLLGYGSSDSSSKVYRRLERAFDKVLEDLDVGILRTEADSVDNWLSPFWAIIPGMT